MVLVRFEEDKREWIIVDTKDKKGGELYLDGFLKKKLDFAKDQIRKDFDVGGLIVGGEGTGKSTMASNIMIYMTDMEFDPRKHIIKDHDHALEVLENIPDEGGVMFDEGYLLFYSADVLTKKQKEITKVFSIIRQKKLFFLIVAPSFFRLSTYFALDRTKFMIRVYTDNKGERGFFKWWGDRAKKKLYQVHKRDHIYTNSGFSGRFRKCSLLDETYKQIKRETLKKAFDEAREARKPKETIRRAREELEFEIVERNQELGNWEVAGILGCSLRKVERIRNKLKLPLKKTGPTKKPIKK